MNFSVSLLSSSQETLKYVYKLWFIWFWCHGRIASSAVPQNTRFTMMFTCSYFLPLISHLIQLHCTLFRSNTHMHGISENSIIFFNLLSLFVTCLAGQLLWFQIQDWTNLFMVQQTKFWSHCWISTPVSGVYLHLKIMEVKCEFPRLLFSFISLGAYRELHIYGFIV